MITLEGRNYRINVLYRNQATTQLYIGLIAMPASGSPVLRDTDTMASHPGWTEFTGYSGNRLALNLGAPSAGEAGTNGGTVPSYTPTASGEIAAVFITTDPTKGGTSGTLVHFNFLAQGRIVAVAGQSFNLDLRFEE